MGSKRIENLKWMIANLWSTPPLAGSTPQERADVWINGFSVFPRGREYEVKVYRGMKLVFMGPLEVSKLQALQAALNRSEALKKEKEDQ